MSAETDEALAQMNQQAEQSVRATEAHIGHTEAIGPYIKAKASLYSALAFAVSVGTLTGIGWSIFEWVR